MGYQIKIVIIYFYNLQILISKVSLAKQTFFFYIRCHVQLEWCTISLKHTLDRMWNAARSLTMASSVFGLAALALLCMDSFIPSSVHQVLLDHCSLPAAWHKCNMHYSNSKAIIPTNGTVIVCNGSCRFRSHPDGESKGKRRSSR